MRYRQADKCVLYRIEIERTRVVTFFRENPRWRPEVTSNTKMCKFLQFFRILPTTGPLITSGPSRHCWRADSCGFNELNMTQIGWKTRELRLGEGVEFAQNGRFFSKSSRTSPIGELAWWDFGAARTSTITISAGLLGLSYVSGHPPYMLKFPPCDVPRQQGTCNFLPSRRSLKNANVQHCGTNCSLAMQLVCNFHGVCFRSSYIEVKRMIKLENYLQEARLRRREHAPFDPSPQSQKRQSSKLRY